MRDLRIVFMGTPEFAVTVLDKLVKQNYNIVGVVTVPDKPAGRGQKLKHSAVKKYALENDLNVLQPTNLKSDDFLDTLTRLKANLQIVVAFRMLPKIIWSLPQFGTFNLHASLLPNYRGAAPINWAIINGENSTGVSTFFIDEKIDTGEIILQSKTDITNEENVGTLHDKLMHIGSDLVIETVELIKTGNVTTTKQPEKDIKAAPKLNNDNCKINWDNNLNNIYNHIRGLNPYPAAWTTLNNNNNSIKVKLYDVEKEYAKHQFKPGKLFFSKKEIKIATNGGYLIIKSLKLAGKKKMDATSLLNGYNFDKNAIMH